MNITYTENGHPDTSDDPLDRIPSFDCVSIRAVLVGEGEDPSQALAEVGIFDPIAIPVVLGEDAPEAGFGDGITPNLIAVLEPDQNEEQDQHAEPQNAEAPKPHSPQNDDMGTLTLPAAYGMQSLAPIGPGSRDRLADGAQPPSPALPAGGAGPSSHVISGRRPTRSVER